MNTAQFALLKQYVALGNEAVRAAFEALMAELQGLQVKVARVSKIETLARELGILPSQPAIIWRADVGAQAIADSRRLQGQFIGLMRGLPKHEQAKMRKLAREKGREAAVEAMRKMRAESRKRDEFVANGARLAAQLDLLRVKAQTTNGHLKKNGTHFVELCRRHGLSRAEAYALLARTQGKFRGNFVKRLTAGLSPREVHAKIAELAKLYQVEPATLRAEAGLQ